VLIGLKVNVSFDYIELFFLIDFTNLKKELKDQIGEDDDEFINIEQNIDRLLDVH